MLIPNLFFALSVPFVAKLNGGADGARTRDLQRDRLAF